MKLWIARDKNRTLTLFQEKPELSKYDPIWRDPYNRGHMIIDQYLFPEVTFENSPQQIQMVLMGNLLDNTPGKPNPHPKQTKI